MILKFMRMFSHYLFYGEFLFMNRLQNKPKIIRQLKRMLDYMKVIYDNTGVGVTFLRYTKIKGIHVYTDFPYGISYVFGDRLQFFLTCS